MKIYTKTGDKGTTGLIGGTRVKKYDIRLEAYGTIDELNSIIGLIRSSSISNYNKDVLIRIQNKLFVIGGTLATDIEKTPISKKLPCSTDDVHDLEIEIDKIMNQLPPMTHFILPGGSIEIGYSHIARSVCRRAERRILELADNKPIPEVIIQYVNRLSDYLFALSRIIALDNNIEEKAWIPEK